MKTYEQLMQWREKSILQVATNHDELNLFHDELMKKIVEVALKIVQSEWGLPPAHFAFFLMGSAGRGEQTLFSDQDHGIIHDGSGDDAKYFLTLGKEISKGFAICGYPYCDGKVMASNPLWNKSIDDWKTQVNSWLDRENWESLRNFTIFFDSKVLVGEGDFLSDLKNIALTIIDERPSLFLRLVENMKSIKKGIGPIGQFVTEKYGEKAGTIHLKESAYFPYVNALRLLAFKEKMIVASTFERFSQLSDNYNNIKVFDSDFKDLLHFRLKMMNMKKNQETVHLIKIHSLRKEDKKKLKKIMKNSYRLLDETIVTFGKGK